METKMLNEYNLRQASIYELRNIAREMGVISPTTLKKEELVTKVLNILSGKDKPQMPKSKQGRPPKKPFGYESVEDNKKNDEVESFFNYDITKLPVLEDKLGVLSSTERIENNISYDCLEGNVEVGEGYYFVVDDGNGFIFEKENPSKCENIILVNKSVADNNNLRSGDYVKCKYKKLQTADSNFLTEVLEINGLNDFSKRQDFDSFKVVSGDRNIVLFDNRLKFKTFCDDFNNKVENIDKTKILKLNISVLPEETMQYQNTDKIENFYTIVQSTTKQNIFTINLFLERIKRLVELGFDVLVFVNNINNIVKFKNFEMQYSFDDIKDKSFDFFYKFLSVSNKYDNGGSACLYLGLKKVEQDVIYNTLNKEIRDYDCNMINCID